MRKNKGKKYAFGVMAAWCLAVGAAALTGCGTKEVHNKITVESSVEETAAEAIEIETEAPQTEAPETEAPDPDEQEPRVEKDGRIRSYLTGEMVPVSQGNRRTDCSNCGLRYGFHRSHSCSLCPVLPIIFLHVYFSFSSNTMILFSWSLISSSCFSL